MLPLLSPHHPPIPTVETPLEAVKPAVLDTSDPAGTVAKNSQNNQQHTKNYNQNEHQNHKHVSSVSSHCSTTQLLPSTPKLSSSANSSSQAMTPSSNKLPSASPKIKKICFRCSDPISGQFVRALNQCWHMNCFTCYDCATPCSQKFFPVSHSDNHNHNKAGDRAQNFISSGEGDTEYSQVSDQNTAYTTLDQVPLCETCYFRRLDLLCHSCNGALRSSYITAIGHKYHVEHFTCSMCSTLFGVEDSYYEHQDSIYCLYHYSTLFATKCNGCCMPIIKQFVEIFRNGKQQQWHPECYMIHKFWNVRMADAKTQTDPVIQSIKQHRESLIEHSASSKALLLHKQQSIEDKIVKIWTSLCAFEESTAACISDMLQFSSSVQYSKALDATTRLTDKIQILFTALDGLFVTILKQQTYFQKHNQASTDNKICWFENFGPLETYYIGKEPKTLCKKLVNFMSLLSKAKETEFFPLVRGATISATESTASKDSTKKFTRDLLSLVTSLAHYLKLLIRLGLNGALQWGQLVTQATQATLNIQDVNSTAVLNSPEDFSANEPLHVFLDLVDKHRDSSTLSTLSISNSGFINGKTTDQCTLCSKSIETESIRHTLNYTKRWHMSCFNCHKCQKKLAKYMKQKNEYSYTEEIDSSSTGNDHSEVKIWWNNTEGSIVCYECFDDLTYEEKTKLTPSPFIFVSKLDQFTYLLRIALERLRIILHKYDEKQNRLLNQKSNIKSDSRGFVSPMPAHQYSHESDLRQQPSRTLQASPHSGNQLQSMSSNAKQHSFSQQQLQPHQERHLTNASQNPSQSNQQYLQQNTQRIQGRQQSPSEPASSQLASQTVQLSSVQQNQELPEKQQQYQQQKQGYMTTLTDIRRLRSLRTDNKVSDSTRQAASGNNIVHMSESQEELVRPGNSRSASTNNNGGFDMGAGEEELNFSDNRPSLNIRRDQGRGYDQVTSARNKNHAFEFTQYKEPSSPELCTDRSNTRNYHHLLAKPQQYLPNRLRSQTQSAKEKNIPESINNRQAPSLSYQKPHLDRTTDLLTNDALTLDDIPRIVAAEEAREQRPNAFRHHDPTFQRSMRINTRSVSSVKASAPSISESKSLKSIGNHDNGGQFGSGKLSAPSNPNNLSPKLNSSQGGNNLYLNATREVPPCSLKIDSGAPASRNYDHTMSDSSTISVGNVAGNSKVSMPQSKYISEMSAPDMFLLRHIAVVRLHEIVHDSFTMEELLSLIETRKAPSFWNKMGKAFGGDKGAVPTENLGATNSIFGASLEYLVEQYGVYSSLGMGPSKLKVPSFVDDCISAMRQMDMSVEGVFRKNGNIRRLKELTESINKNPESSSTVSSENPVQLAALFKKFLRELPDPLLTFKLQKLFLLSQKLDSYEDRLQVLHLSCILLPRAHRDSMEVIFFFLKWVASFSHIDKESGSKMDVHNLATVITPNILYARLTTKERERDKEYVVAGDPGSSGGGSDYGDAYFLSIEAVNTLIDNNDEFSQVPNSLLLVLNSPEAGLYQNNENDSHLNVNTTINSVKSPKLASGATTNDLTTKEIIARIERFVHSDSGREKLRYCKEVENMDYEDNAGIEFVINDIDQGVSLPVETDIN